MNLVLATLVNAPDSTLWLKTGGVNIGLVALIVEGLIEVVLKPFIDGAISPRNPRHDAVMQALILVVTAGAVVGAQAVGPIGISNPTDVGAIVVQTVLALFTEWGIYLKLRGGIPQTPTTPYLERLAAIHGPALAPYIDPTHFPTEQQPKLP